MLSNMSHRFDGQAAISNFPGPLEKLKMKKSVCILLPLVFLFGCTTIQDFREMSPEQRAKAVCDRDETVRRIRNERNDVAWKIESTQEEMLRGYTFDEGCSPFSPSGDFDSNPGPYCYNVTTPVNPAIQKQHLENWKATLNQLDQALQAAFSSCYSRVMHMSPEEAYSCY